MMYKCLAIDGYNLTIGDVVSAATVPGVLVSVDGSAAKRLAASRELKLDFIESEQAIYGVTTGFGDSVRFQISPSKAADLQHNLIRYHLNGTGPIAPSEVIRATLLIRANCLARGNSGVNPVVVERLLALLRHDILPCIPERGSVGASGDLVPLCYAAAALIGEGDVFYEGRRTSAAAALLEAGLTPVALEAKDGLALINGTSFSSAYAVLATSAARNLATVADVCTAMTSEALLGNQGHFAPFIHNHKPHPGQRSSAKLVSEFLDGSRLAMPHSHVLDLNAPLAGHGFQKLTRSIQDRYSVRCAPHVVGVLRDTLAWVQSWLEVEINSSNDNPLFDVDGKTVHSGGNFYGGHVVQAMDALKVAVANVVDLLDRQVALLVDDKFNNGLTPNLVNPAEESSRAAGLHHGFKGMQIACSALTAEALKMSGPVSVFSRSTEAHNQDKVSMAPISAREARTITGLATEVAAIHLLAACQALDLRGPDLMAPRTRTVHTLIRRVAPFVAEDRAMDADIAKVSELIASGEISNLVGATAVETA